MEGIDDSYACQPHDGSASRAAGKSPTTMTAERGVRILAPEGLPAIRQEAGTWGGVAILSLLRSSLSQGLRSYQELFPN